MKKLLLLAIIAIMMILSGCAANMGQEPETPIEKLINASETGDITKVEQLLKEGVDVNTKNIYGHTPLYYAAYEGKKDVVELLIAHGANINNSGDDPLYGALDGGHKDIATLLIKKGANPNSILHIAIVREKADIVEFLIAYGVDINDGALYDAVDWAVNSQNVFDVLIAHGADVNVKSKSGNWTLLHTAADRGRTNIVKFLIAHGADVNAKNNTGDTPLHLAKAHNHGETADILIANGADVNIRNNKGESTEMFANRVQAENKTNHEAAQAAKHAKENEAKHCLSNYDGREYTTTVKNNCNKDVWIEVRSEDLFGEHKNIYVLSPGESKDIFPDSNHINTDDVTKASFGVLLPY